MLEEDTKRITPEEIAQRRSEQKPVNRVIFGVRSLYGLNLSGVKFPLNETESIDTGQICISLDPDSDATCNVGFIDFEQRYLKIKYGVQAIFPGLYELITQRRFDPSLLNPLRAVATDECSVTEDYSGWKALGCLDFLPGSVWAGASGG